MCIICSIYGIYSIDIAVTGMSAGGWDMSAPSKYIAVQTFSLFLGIAGFVLFTVIDADILGQQWKILCAINVLLLVALVIFGQDDGTGNKSWIRFAGIGIQPSEVIKVLYIVVAAKQMTYLKEYRDINSFLSVVQMAAHFGIVFLMIVGVSSDLGSAGILLGVFLVMFYALGVKLYWFAIGGALVASAIPLLWNYFLKDYQKKRLVAPYDASVDPDGWGIRWQTTQSKMSLASGRLTGVDDEHSTTVFTGKHTDFIFAVAGEEFGFIGCLLIIALLSLLILRLFYVSFTANSTFSSVLTIGIAGMFLSQTFENILMCLGLFPVIGITLPLFSYGRSSVITMYAALGIAAGVRMREKPSWLKR